MINYICTNCDNLKCETSTCPVCNGRTYIDKSEIYYCEKCCTPIFDKRCPICNNEGIYIGTDIRPVFPEERLLIETIENEPFKYAGKSIWNTSGNNYFIDGKKHRFIIKEVIEKIDANDIRKEIEKNKEKNRKYEEDFFNQDYIKNFIQANMIRYNSIVTEAHDYIKRISQDYTADTMFVSFSGGKDSTVTSDLVMNALNNDKIIHIYGDTTLEYPETKDYLEIFKKKHPATPILVAKNKDQNFNELCKVIGPPSRVMSYLHHTIHY